MLRLLDFSLTLLHLIIISFNLAGWIRVRTKRLHLYGILLTAASWAGLGYWYGFGYCPVTDWQWKVKEQLGEGNLPDSFIKYLADKITGTNIDPALIDWLTGVSFVLAAFASVYVNFLRKPRKLVQN